MRQVSPTAARRMKPAMSSHERDHFMSAAISQALRAVAEDGDHLGETVPVVLAQLLQTAVQVVEAVLVRRQHLATS